MKSMGRLHLYPHREPRDTAYIVADRRALRDLAKKLTQAADSSVGIDSVTFHGSDGHEYKLMIVSDVSEDEWQVLPLPQLKLNAASELSIVKIYHEYKQTST